MFERLLAHRHIAGLDLDAVRLKAMSDLGWGSEKTTHVELEYRRFLLALARKRPEDIISPPSQEVDEFWHRHILDTRRYREDCEKVFGRYMDHTPGLGVEEQSAADAKRLQVYEEHNVDAAYFDSGGGGSGEGSSGSDGGGPSHHGHGSHGVDGGHHSGSDGDSGHGGDGGDGGGDGGGGDGGGGGCGAGCGGGCGA